MASKKVVVAGATGLVGSAALRHFSAVGGCEVVALSRRKPRQLHGARHVAVDLTDPAQCQHAAAELQGATHLVYAALYEAPNLVDGWRDPGQIRTNDAMLRRRFAPRFHLVHQTVGRGDHFVHRRRRGLEGDRTESFHRSNARVAYDVSPAYTIHHLMQHEAEHRAEMGRAVAGT